ncbi:MAG: glycosyltransferase family 2 protein [bacterium]|nr:glycosyltransferase family 2 protein [bacterium]
MSSSDATPNLSGPELSVVIPAFNEEVRLGTTLETIIGYLDGRALSYEILASDDGSSDGTAAVAEAFAGRGVKVLRAPQNQGKGAATRRGVLESIGRLVLLTDADLSTPIAEITKLEPHLDEADLVIGSRAVRGARITLHQPLYRELMGKTFNKMIRLAGVWGINDTQCGFKLLRGETARALFADLVTPGFAFDVELLWLARRRGHRVAEVGVTWENSPASRVHPLIDPPRMLLEIIRFRLKHRGRS